MRRERIAKMMPPPPRTARKIRNSTKAKSNKTREMQRMLEIIAVRAACGSGASVVDECRPKFHTVVTCIPEIFAVRAGVYC